MQKVSIIISAAVVEKCSINLDITQLLHCEAKKLHPSIVQ